MPLESVGQVFELLSSAFGEGWLLALAALVLALSKKRSLINWRLISGPPPVEKTSPLVV